MNTQQTRKRSFQQGTSPEVPPPAKRPRRSGGVEPESVQEQMLKLDPDALKKQCEIVEMLRDASKMRLDADEEWYKDGGYEEEEKYLATRQRELDTLKMALETREGFQKGKDMSAALDREERKIRTKRGTIRREFDRLATQARSLDVPFLLKLIEHHCIGSNGVERATGIEEKENNGEDKEVEE